MLIVVYWNHQTQTAVEFAERLGLPFGAGAAVLGVNRVGKALEAIAIHGLGPFVDYTINMPDAVAGFATDAFSDLLVLLGWDAEVKVQPSGVYTSLGVVSVLEDVMTKQQLTLRNAESRMCDL